MVDSVNTETGRKTGRGKIGSNEIAYLNFQSGNGAIVLDVSPEGLGFQAADPLEPDKSFSFRLSVPGRPDINLSGRLAWLDSTQKRGGLQLDLSDENRTQFLDWQSKYAPPEDDANPAPSPAPTPTAAPVARSTPAATPVSPREPMRSDPAPHTKIPAAPAEPQPRRTRVPPVNTFARQPNPILGSRAPIFVSEWEAPHEESHAGRNFLVFAVIVALCMVIAGGSYYLAGKRQVGDLLIHVGQSLGGALHPSPQGIATAPTSPAAGTTASANNAPAAAAAPSNAPVNNVPPAAASNTPDPPTIPGPTENAPQLAAPELSPRSPAALGATSQSSAAAVASTAAAPPIAQPTPQSNVDGVPPSQAAGASNDTAAAAVKPRESHGEDSPRRRYNAPARANSSQRSAASPSESESDILLAQRYLADSNPADAQIAASLLWSAIGAGNTQAELVLGDLYLRGQGSVRQNCRQAQVLLVAAQSANVPGATEKLQKLATYGCR